MFYQYLRGKQYELLAVRAVQPQLADARDAGRTVVPVIEPVKPGIDGLGTAAEVTLAAGGSLAVVTNPAVGEVLGQDLLQDAWLASMRQAAPDRLIPALILLSTTRSDTVRAFLARYSGAPVVVVHQESCPTPGPVAGALAAHDAPVTHLLHEAGTAAAYRGQFGPAPRVLLRDGFRRQDRNAGYPPAEFFSDLHQTYRTGQPAYGGFGDFSTVGNHYAEGGGQPRAVAIHLTHQHEDGTVWVRHFLSDRVDTQADTAGKFLEALDKLAAFAGPQPSPVLRTAALAEFLDLHERRHFPQLGKIKELSMRHHLELMATLA